MSGGLYVLPLSFFLLNFAHPSPNFHRGGVKYFEVGLIMSFEAF